MCIFRHESKWLLLTTLLSFAPCTGSCVPEDEQEQLSSVRQPVVDDIADETSSRGPDAGSAVEDSWSRGFDSGAVDTAGRLSVTHKDLQSLGPDRIDHYRNPCVRVRCEPYAASCTLTFEPDGTPCSDDDLCTVGDVCDRGRCIGTPRDCDDGESCSTDTCEPEIGVCVHESLPDGAICSDGAGVCTADTCVYLPFALPDPDVYGWQLLACGPQPDVPAGCDGQALPCNAGTFSFVWPADSGQLSCYDGLFELPSCPSAAESFGCASTPYCGQDAQYGWDLDMPGWSVGRYVVMGQAPEQVVSDTWTGLVWQLGSASALSWADAVAYCDGIGPLGGLSDWRLPGYHELLSLLSFNAQPVTDFPGAVSAGELWSADSAAADESRAHVVGLWEGYTATLDKTATWGISGPLQVRCVASGSVAVYPQQRYFAGVLADEPLLYDAYTGLLWPRTAPVQAAAETWASALSHCEALSYGGRTDWRLPSALELASLVDTTRSDPALDPLAFPSGGSQWVYTSTTSPAAEWNTMRVQFVDGQLDGWMKGGFTWDPHEVRGLRRWGLPAGVRGDEHLERVWGLRGAGGQSRRAMRDVRLGRVPVRRAGRGGVQRRHIERVRGLHGAAGKSG